MSLDSGTRLVIRRAPKPRWLRVAALLTLAVFIVFLALRRGWLW